MRIRQIKPDFWTDKVLSGFDDATRLFYIGLWMEADDDGYLRWEPDQIAARLYPYKSVVGRERFVRTATLRLADSGHVVMLDCERHVQVPNLPKYQIVASTRRVVRVHGEHNAQCVRNAEQVSAHPERERERERNGNGDFSHTSERTRESQIDELQRILVDDTSTAPAKRAAKKALERLGIKTDG